MKDERVEILASFLDDLNELVSLFNDVDMDDIKETDTKNNLKEYINKFYKLSDEITKWLYRDKVSKYIGG